MSSLVAASLGAAGALTAAWVSSRLLIILKNWFGIPAGMVRLADGTRLAVRTTSSDWVYLQARPGRGRSARLGFPRRNLNAVVALLEGGGSGSVEMTDARVLSVQLRQGRCLLRAELPTAIDVFDESVSWPISDSEQVISAVVRSAL